MRAPLGMHLRIGAIVTDGDRPAVLTDVTIDADGERRLLDASVSPLTTSPSRPHQASPGARRGREEG